MAQRYRIEGIDFWRGFALLSIFVNHTPDNLLNAITHRNFGLSDAAEAFVFLSGLSVALAYGNRFLDGQVRAAMVALGRRLFTIYWVQILISLLAAAFLASCVAILGKDDVMEDADHDALFDSPLRGIIAILGLSHQIVFFQILPLYIVLLLITPLLLALARRDPKLMLLASAAVYIVARVFEINLPTWPVEGEWFFNPFAWQLLFAIGLTIGIGLRTGVPATNGKLFAACLVAIVASAFMVTNGFGFTPGLWDQVRESLDVNKTDLGLLRLLHFLALAYVVFYSGVTGWLARTIMFKPLCLIGRHSLPVFALGSILSMFDRAIMDTYELAVIPSLAILAVGIILQYLIAWYLAWRKMAAKTAAAKTGSVATRLPTAYPSPRPAET
jgi:hypothetical protein